MPTGKASPRKKDDDDDSPRKSKGKKKGDDDEEEEGDEKKPSKLQAVKEVIHRIFHRDKDKDDDDKKKKGKKGGDDSDEGAGAEGGGGKGGKGKKGKKGSKKGGKKGAGGGGGKDDADDSDEEDDTEDEDDDGEEEIGEDGKPIKKKKKKGKDGEDDDDEDDGWVPVTEASAELAALVRLEGEGLRGCVVDRPTVLTLVVPPEIKRGRWKFNVTGPKAPEMEKKYLKGRNIALTLTFSETGKYSLSIYLAFSKYPIHGSPFKIKVYEKESDIPKEAEKADEAEEAAGTESTAKGDAPCEDIPTARDDRSSDKGDKAKAKTKDS